MRTIKNKKLNLARIFLTFLSICFVIICVITIKQTRLLDLDKEGLAQMEYISSGIQRVSKLELENSYDDTLIAYLDIAVADLFTYSDSSKYFTKNEKMTLLLREIATDLEIFRSAVETYRETNIRNELFITSENNYNNSSNAIKEANLYLEELSISVQYLRKIAMGNAILIALSLIVILKQTGSELKKNKELSQDMFIDIATGLYNRSKCQEIMKSTITPKNLKERAVVVFDLNDLKRTNDTLGHRVGDQLIADFATQLKEVTKLFPCETFVGRYGGDEFIVSFASIEEPDVQRYIQEVDVLMKKFNETKNKPYNLSSAAGYSITTAETKSLTIRELFDLADSDMYKNKIAMKEKAKQDLKDKGIDVPDVVDDRLL